MKALNWNGFVNLAFGGVLGFISCYIIVSLSKPSLLNPPLSFVNAMSWDLEKDGQVCIAMPQNYLPVYATHLDWQSPQELKLKLFQPPVWSHLPESRPPKTICTSLPRSYNSQLPIRVIVWAGASNVKVAHQKLGKLHK